jgi:hypothetical protein
LLYRQYLVPVHSIVILLRPQAAHANLNEGVAYAPRSARGKMDYEYEPIWLWERPAAELLAGDLGVVPLALLGQLPAGLGAPFADRGFWADGFAGVPPVGPTVVSRSTSCA